MGLKRHGLAQAHEAGAGAQAQEGGAIDEERAVGGHGADLAGGAARAKAWALRHGAWAGGLAVRAVFPPACLACGEMTEDAHALCGPCWRDAGFLAGGLVCDLCGTGLPGRDDGRDGGTAAQCDDCLGAGRPWEKGRAAMPYRGTGRVLALALKRGDRTDLARPLGGWMARAARPLLRDLRGEAVLVPVPLHWTRLFARRFNQTALLARHAGAALGVPVLPDALVRPRRTASLGHKGARARREALADAISPHPRRGRALRGRTAIVVDDVMTTGATLAATAEAALEAGAAAVRVVVLARAGRGDG